MTIVQSSLIAQTPKNIANNLNLRCKVLLLNGMLGLYLQMRSRQHYSS